MLIQQHFEKQMMELLIIDLIQSLQDISDISLFFLKSITLEQTILLDVCVLLDLNALFLNLLNFLRINQLCKDILDDLFAESIFQLVFLVNEIYKIRDLFLWEEETVKVLQQLLVAEETEVLLQDPH